MLNRKTPFPIFDLDLFSFQALGFLFVMLGLVLSSVFIILRTLFGHCYSYWFIYNFIISIGTLVMWALTALLPLEGLLGSLNLHELLIMEVLATFKVHTYVVVPVKAAVLPYCWKFERFLFYYLNLCQRCSGWCQLGGFNLVDHFKGMVYC